MKRIFYTGTLTDNILLVEMTHYAPEMLSADDLSKGYLLEFEDGEPTPTQPAAPGKTYIKKLNIDTKEVFYEEVDLPVSSQEDAMKQNILAISEKLTVERQNRLALENQLAATAEHIANTAISLEETKNLLSNMEQSNVFLENQLFETETALIQTEEHLNNAKTELSEVKQVNNFLEDQLFKIETRLLEGGL
jgi:hypothetical protein